MLGGDGRGRTKACCLNVVKKSRTYLCGWQSQDLVCTNRCVNTVVFFRVEREREREKELMRYFFDPLRFFSCSSIIVIISLADRCRLVVFRAFLAKKLEL